MKYLSYVLRHKWFVFVECCKLGIPLRGLCHDNSKFLSDEWFAYVDSFYGGPFEAVDSTPAGLKYQGFHMKTVGTVQLAFDQAWLLHQHRNPHHWQFWMLTQDEDEPKILAMPYRFVLEMVADWKGAGRAQGHGNNIIPWYEKNRDKIKLHSETRHCVEKLIYK